MNIRGEACKKKVKKYEGIRNYELIPYLDITFYYAALTFFLIEKVILIKDNRDCSLSYVNFLNFVYTHNRLNTLYEELFSEL